MKRRKLSLKKCLIAFFILVLIGVLIVGSFIFLNLRPASNEEEFITWSVAEGTDVSSIIDNLESDGLIRNSLVFKIYFKLFASDLEIQAGNYELSPSMDVKEVIEALKHPSGEEEITVTFDEGNNIIKIARTINQNFGYKESEVIKTLDDKDFVKELIEKYWFLTDDILNKKIYHPLEGYLAPNTYNFYKSATIEDIVYKLLDQTEMVLEEYKEAIEKSEYSIHELLTIASIAQMEGTNSKTLAKVTSVVYNRLSLPMRLEMCSTAYYGAKKIQGEDEMGDADSLVNSYNTYELDGLPVGPIANPSVASIKATINPAKTSYYYFASDSSLNLYFSKTYSEHLQTIANLQAKGVWSGS